MSRYKEQWGGIAAPNVAVIIVVIVIIVVAVLSGCWSWAEEGLAVVTGCDRSTPVWATDLKGCNRGPSHPKFGATATTGPVQIGWVRLGPVQSQSFLRSIGLDLQTLKRAGSWSAQLAE
jgi:hypothetical protein